MTSDFSSALSYGQFENSIREQMAFWFAPGKGLMALAFLAPKNSGNGNPVLVIPGYGVGDGAMSIFRNMLERSGYRPNGWGAGMNEGFSLEDEKRLAAMTKDIHWATGKKVSLVGWSLGGIYARAIAQDVPTSVQQVITMGTPWKGLEHTSLARRLERDSGKSLRELMPPEVHDRLLGTRLRLKVPFASIYSRHDGVSDWEACHVDVNFKQRCQSIEVTGQHFDMPYSTEVFDIVDQILQTDISQWAPYQGNQAPEKSLDTSESFRP